MGGIVKRQDSQAFIAFKSCLGTNTLLEGSSVEDYHGNRLMSSFPIENCWSLCDEVFFNLPNQVEGGIGRYKYCSDVSFLSFVFTPRLIDVVLCAVEILEETY